MNAVLSLMKFSGTTSKTLSNFKAKSRGHVFVSQPNFTKLFSLNVEKSRAS